MNPYVIAEAGVNHNGILGNAYQLIDAAKAAGANCVKFQAFFANEVAIKNSPKAEYQKKDNSKNQYDMLIKYELSIDDFKKIKFYCEDKKIDFLATPFSKKWVDILFDLGVNAFKIASSSIGSKNLLSSIGCTKLPVILSTGMSNITEIKNAIDILTSYGCPEISLLHCVTLYPAQIEQINLFSILELKEKFNLKVGFSDHTEDIITGGLAVAAGATIIEKHFTLNKNMEGPDHAMSLLPHQLKMYIQNIRKVTIICGEKIKKPLKEELVIKKVIQTSLITKERIPKGGTITKEILTEKRPSFGIPIDRVYEIIGKQVNKNIEKDSIITWNDIKL